MDMICLFFSLGTITCVSVFQSETLRTFVVGGDTTLECIIDEIHENYYSWFRQSLGEAPVCIITLYSGSPPQHHGDFEQDKRFIAEENGSQFTLTISDTKESDAGIYYCAARDYNLIIFSKGVFLIYEG